MTRKQTSGRRDTWLYRKNREIVLAQSDLCGLCGHGNAQTVDHVIPAKLWPRDLYGKPLPGMDDLPNLRPAHGTLSPGQVNYCPTCGLACNQTRGARLARRPQTRDWGV